MLHSFLSGNYKTKYDENEHFSFHVLIKSQKQILQSSQLMKDETIQQQYYQKLFRRNTTLIHV